MNELLSYQSANGLGFNDPSERAEELFGKPRLEQRNREGELELFHDDFILRFSADGSGFRECTVPFDSSIRLDGEELGWTEADLESLCKLDGEPMEFHGTVILFGKGVALTGMGKGEESDRSVTLFRRGDWDAFKEGMKRYPLGRGGK